VQVTAQDFLVPYSWRNLLSTLQDAAKRATRTASGRSTAIISVHIFVDKEGLPKHNSRPTFTRMEPRRDGEAFEQLLDTLDDEQRELLLKTFNS